MSGPIPPHLRSINFAACELLLDLIHALKRHYAGVDMESLLILLCVSDACMRPFMLDPVLREQVREAPAPPEEVRGAISRLMIADKTGLARETVRRKVAALVRAGLLFVDPEGRIRMTPNLTDPRGQTALEEAHQAIVRYFDRLEQLGAHIEVPAPKGR
ncbi:MAG: hypothetical protein JNJ73_05535 [Hyphomonadaceae bacterium]|nr:hypothetical protein [Hyphomonadaceae bacterium]